jgi:hypothetical protein
MYILLFVSCSFQIFALENSVNIEESDHSVLNLAQSLYESGDICSSYCVYNQIIEEKESNKCFDSVYIEALYKIFPIAQMHSYEHALEIVHKIQKYDSNFPTIKVEDGKLVFEKVPPEMKETSWIKEIFQIFGRKINDEDIKIDGDTIQILMPCCCSCKPSEK